jgi:hypothetical protein
MLKHSPLRHRLLAMAERGTFEQYCANPMARKREVWKYRLVKGVLGGPEARGMRELEAENAVRSVPQNRYHLPRPIVRTPHGETLLSEWNEKYGDPSAR